MNRLVDIWERVKGFYAVRDIQCITLSVRSVPEMFSLHDTKDMFLMELSVFHVERFLENSMKKEFVKGFDIIFFPLTGLFKFKSTILAC